MVAKYTESDQQKNRDNHINRIKNAVTNLTDLLNELLSIGKIKDGKIVAHYTTFNIKQILKSIIAEMENLVKAGQQVLYKHIGIEEVLLDPSLLRNIILNLLNNAIKFSPANCIITINSFTDEKIIRLSVKNSCFE